MKPRFCAVDVKVLRSTVERTEVLVIGVAVCKVFAVLSVIAVVVVVVVAAFIVVAVVVGAAANVITAAFKQLRWLA